MNGISIKIVCHETFNDLIKNYGQDKSLLIVRTMTFYSNNLIGLFIMWQVFSLRLHFDLVRKGWVNLLKLEVLEALTRLELPDATKQVYSILDRRINHFMCYITSTIQENDEMLPLQV